MLGKGLESLIPQKGGGQGDNNADGNRPAQFVHDPQQPVHPQSQPAHQSQPQSPQESSQTPHPVQPAGQPQSTPVIRPQPQPQHQPQPTPQTNSPSLRSSSTRQTNEPQTSGSVYQIEIEKVVPNPDQPRRRFDEDGLRDLANSIREFGILQPLVVSKVEKETPQGVDVEYQIIAGERRYLASKMLGLPRVPAIIKNVGLEREKLELAVIENIQRENLNPIETARAFQRLQEEFRMTQREIAAKLGKSREVVANMVRLLDLPDYIQGAVEKGELSESNARLLIALEDPGAQKKLFEDAVANKLTTRDVKDRIQALAGTAGAVRTGRRGRPPLAEQEPLSPEERAIQDELTTALGAPVEIRKNATNGKITITFFSEEELANILEKLNRDRGERF